MIPAVGRIVHYRSYGTPGGEFQSKCRAAIITEVGEDTISLAAVNPTGLFFDQNKRYDPELSGGTWHWYQDCDGGTS